MAAPSAILFDLDGVLLRSEEVWLHLLEEAGRKFRGRPVTREEFAPTFGQGTAADVRAFGFSCTPAELDAFYAENFRRHATEVWVEQSARGVLQSLADRGLLLGVVTNTVSSLARDLLQVAGLLPYFQVVACPDQGARPKPAPDLILHALSGLRVRPEEAWMVGDSKFDREAAAAARVRFIGLHTDGDLRIEELSSLSDLFSR